MEIVVDTETTGTTNLSFANQFNYRQWPRLVEIAWIVFDEDRIDSRETHLIRPNGYEIPPEASRIHGISHEQAYAQGVGIGELLNELQLRFASASAIIAHNLSFDLGIIESEVIRNQSHLVIPEKRVCTMHLGQRYLIKTKGLRSIAPPRLEQLHEALFGSGFAPKHQAASDASACLRVYRRLKHLDFA